MVYRLFLASCVILLTACAQPFPRPGELSTSSLTPDGDALFQSTFAAHGGERIDALIDVSLAIEGEWKTLITKIQPLVTDFRYRVRSEERLLPGENAYAALFTGPDGTKKVFRAPDNTTVFYNDVASSDSDVLGSTALTADAFMFFLLGPLGLARHQDGYVRIADGESDGKDYFRIYKELIPGFGASARDEIVLWIDQETRRTFRVQITLEGFESTKGAHVDVTFLDYVERDGFIFPSQFFERVLAPIGIDAHAWRLTGLDLNRGFGQDDLKGMKFEGKAGPDASPL